MGRGLREMAHIKDLMGIVYGINFRSFGYTLTEIRILEKLDGLYKYYPIKFHKNKSFTIFYRHVRMS
jgi:hypothetical protein